MSDLNPVPHTPITQEQFDKICESIENGSAIKKACESMHISTRSFWDFQEIIGEAAKHQYARSLLVKNENLADEMLEIADDELEDDARQKAVRIDTRKWLLSKQLPKKYGDSVMQKLADSDGNNIAIPSMLQVILVDKKDHS